MRDFNNTPSDLGSSKGADHWLLRRSTSLQFFISSILVLATWMFVYGLYFLHRIGWLTYPINSQWFVALCILVALLGVPSSLYLLIGMLWYWFKFDDSRRFVKGLWLLSFLTLGWLASAGYYFTVYRRQVPPRNRGLFSLLKKTLQTTLLLGCVLFVVTLAVLGLWPDILHRTRAPLYMMAAGSWSVLLEIGYLVIAFARRGLLRSKD